MAQYILIAIIAFGLSFAAEKVYKKIRLEKQIFFLLTGLAAGIVIRALGFDSISSIFPGISRYNMISLLFMFFVAGFTISIKQLKKAGSITAKLFVLPSYAELIIVSLLIYTILRLFSGTGFELGFAEILIIASLFSSASPANLIPICSDMIKTGYTGKNNTPGMMITTSVIDGFITIPIIFSAIFVIMTTSAGNKVSGREIVILAATSIIAIALSVFTGIVIGRLILLITSSAFRKLGNESQSKAADYLIIFIAFMGAMIFTFLLYSVDTLEKSVTLLGVLIMCGIGFSINHFDKTSASRIIGRDGNELFSAFGMPIIFLFVGAGIRPEVLLNIRSLVLFACITFAAIAVKGGMAKLVLRGERFTPGERKFAAACYIPKGVSLINFSVIFAAFLNPDSDMLVFMTTLAAFSIIITMPLGLSVLGKAKGKYIEKTH